METLGPVIWYRSLPRTNQSFFACPSSTMKVGRKEESDYTGEVFEEMVRREYEVGPAPKGSDRSSGNEKTSGQRLEVSRRRRRQDGKGKV